MRGGAGPPDRRRTARSGRRTSRPRHDGHGHGHARRQVEELSASRSAGCSGTCGRSARASCSSFLLAIGSVTFAVFGPKILGDATNIIFEGAIGAQLPAGVTQAAGRGRPARQRPEPARGHALRHDRDARLGHRLRRPRQHPARSSPGCTCSRSVFSWGQAYIMAGVTQRTVYRLRNDVDHKLGRLPLRYFDAHPRGDLLSRVTNDIDNIGQSLQQSLTQLITALLTVIGVLIMMITISPLLALVSLLAVPVSLIVTVLIARRSQKQFVAQWASTGSAQRPRRGDAHRARDREGVRPPGRGHRHLRRGERAALPGRVPRPVHLRHHPARDELHLQPQLRRDRGHRRPARRVGPDVARRRRRVHPVLAPVHLPDRPDGEHRSTCCSRRSRRRSASSSCSTRPRRSPTRSRQRTCGDVQGGGRVRGRVVPLRAGHAR